MPQDGETVALDLTVVLDVDRPEKAPPARHPKTPDRRFVGPGDAGRMFCRPMPTNTGTGSGPRSEQPWAGLHGAGAHRADFASLGEDRRRRNIRRRNWISRRIERFVSHQDRHLMCDALARSPKRRENVTWAVQRRSVEKECRAGCI